MRLLGEHLSAGRLEVHEYDQRCRQAATARFRSELDALFDDLPDPRPGSPRPAPATPKRNGQLAWRLTVGAGVLALALLLVVVARTAGVVLLVPLVAVAWLAWQK